MHKTELVHIFSSSYDIYIDSPANGQDPRELKPGEYGFLGNPFIEEDDSDVRFREYFAERISDDPYFKRAVLSMYGKRLGCIDDPQKSHGRFILAWLERQEKSYERVFGPFKTRRF